MYTLLSADIKEGDLTHPLFVWRPYVGLPLAWNLVYRLGRQIYLPLLGLKVVYHHDHLNSLFNNMVSEFLLVFLRLSEVLHYIYIEKEYLS